MKNNLLTGLLARVRQLVAWPFIAQAEKEQNRLFALGLAFMMDDIDPPAWLVAKNHEAAKRVIWWHTFAGSATDIDDNQDKEQMRWCYGEGGPYSLDELGTEAWLTGCPLCGDNCWENATPADRAECDEYFADLSHQARRKELAG